MLPLQTVWATIMNMFYILSGVFRLKNHSVQSHIELLNEISTNDIAGKGRWTKYGEKNIIDFFWRKKTAIAHKTLKSSDFGKLCCFESTSARVVLNSITTKTWDPFLTEVDTNLISHVIIIQSSLIQGGEVWPKKTKW